MRCRPHGVAHLVQIHSVAAAPEHLLRLKYVVSARAAPAAHHPPSGERLSVIPPFRARERVCRLYVVHSAHRQSEQKTALGKLTCQRVTFRKRSRLRSPDNCLDELTDGHFWRAKEGSFSTAPQASIACARLSASSASFAHRHRRRAPRRTRSRCRSRQPAARCLIASHSRSSEGGERPPRNAFR